MPSGTRGSTNRVSPVSRSMQSSSRGLNVDVSITLSATLFRRCCFGPRCLAPVEPSMGWSSSAFCFDADAGGSDDGGVGGVCGEEASAESRVGEET